MGNCIKCKKRYCDCPTDGICDSCLRSTYSNGLRDASANTNCSYTKQILEHYAHCLQTLINKGRLGQLGLSVVSASTYLSYVNSALNSPHNYCLYKNVLDAMTPFIQRAIILQLCD